jgi:phosphopantetheinyl transferase
MNMDAVAAGMTPFRPSPLPPSPDTATGSAGCGGLAWRTPSCAEDVASWFGGAPPCAPPEVPAMEAPPVEVAEPDGDYLSERYPGGWACVADGWSAAGVLGRYLAPCERAAYDRLSAAVQPAWLLGRVAAKDAVRWWLADRGLTVEPAHVVVANEPSGRPVIDTTASPSGGSLREHDLRVSIAHVAGAGVAIVAEGDDVGIDVEEAAPRPRSFARVAFSAHERAERVRATSRPPWGEAAADPHAAMDEATWMAAAWCAKEAAGKAAGTGLQGRPTRFVTRLVGPDLFTVGERLVRCARLDPVRYCSHAGHSLVVGWTVRSGGAAAADLDLDDLDDDDRDVGVGALPAGEPRW